MQARVGDIYIHKDIGDTYLVTDTTSYFEGIVCVNLEKGRICYIGEINWKVFYKPLTHSQERVCK